MSKNKNVYAVILAGGAGTRFWPLSRRTEPKQFLKIYGERSLFQQTLNRVRVRITGQNIFVVTNKAYNKNVREQIRGFPVPTSNILLEPQGKNTAAAICWAAACIQRRNPNAVMAVFPADHLIFKQSVFQRSLAEAVRLAERGYLVIFGIPPTRPETGYGYFKTAAMKEGGKFFLRVIKFIEKPSHDRATRLMREGNYFWNSGMFVWKTSVILNEFKRYQPVLYRLLHNRGIKQAAKVWPKLPAISIDYGILEKSRKVVAVAARNLQWSDVGSWQSLAEVLPKDPQGNFLKGNIRSMASRNIFVWGGARRIATIGLKDLIVVDTPDALLICRMDQSQRVKEISA